MPEYKFLNVVLEEGIGIIELNNPPVNALSAAVFNELGDTLEKFKRNPECRCVILTGHGANFAAGADIKEIKNITKADDGEYLCKNGQTQLYSIENSSIPVIAAINGYALGGGSELALACHIRIASNTAKLGQPEISIGIMPGIGGVSRLARIVGPSKATELCLTGDHIPANEAKDIGLVNMVVPDAELIPKAKELARKIAAKSKSATSFIMRCMREGIRMNIDDALKLEGKLFGEIMMTEDKKEGIAAFFEKRPPKFKDK